MKKLIRVICGCLLLLALLLLDSCDQLFPTKTVTQIIYIDSAASFGNRALRFGDLFDYVEIPKHDSALSPRNVTVELWIKFDTLPSAFNPIIHTAYINDHNSADGFSVKYEQGSFYFRLAVQYNTAMAWNFPVTIVPGQWLHLACTYDGQFSRMYLNGSKKVEGAWTSPVYYSGNGLWLGLGYHSDFGGYSFFPGAIDEVRIWNYARTESQIQSTMFQSLIGNETGLCAYWNFNQDTSWNFVLDRTPNRNHGVIFGNTRFVSSTPF